MRAAVFHKKVVAFFYEHSSIVLFIFFFISVAVRVTNLNRPLSKHHEVNAALVLINAEEWNRKSAAFYNYVPVNSYHFPGDNFSNDIVKQPEYLVNISFGTLWYIMPYLFFEVLHAQPSPLLLQVFNLLLHLVTLSLVYNIALYLFEDEAKCKLKALVTSIIYLFSPAPLWFHGNGYVHEVAVLPFVLAAGLMYLKFIKNGKLTWYQYLLFLVLFVAGVCTDWLMCFVAAAISIHCLWLAATTRGTKYITCVVVVIAAVSIAVTVTAIQFSAFMGFENYRSGLLSRFILRGITGDVQPAGLLKSAGLATFYLTGYGILIPFLIGCFFFLPAFKKRLNQNHLLKGFIVIAGVICLAHHTIFWGFSNIHDYSALKSGLVVSLLSAIAVFSLPRSWQQIVTMAAIIIFNIGLYYFINPPGKYALNGQPYSYFQSLGEKVKATATPEEYIFIDIPEMSLLLTYYSKRYYSNVKDIAEAKEIFKRLPGKTALFVHTDNYRFISSVLLKK